MRRKTWLSLGLGVALLGGGYYYFFMRDTGTTTSGTQVVRVATGSISSTVKTTGKISPVQTSTLSFTKQWVVAKILKKIGDPVSAGEVIAEIDASDAYMDIESARLSLDNARNNYNKLFATTTEADKIKARNSLTESKNTLTLLEAEYTDFLTNQKNTLAESEEQLHLLEEKVKLAESDLDYTKKNISTTSDASNLERDIANSYLSLEEVSRFFPDVIETLKDHLYIENKNSNYYGDLSASNTALKLEAEKLYETIKSDISTYESHLSTLRRASTRSLDDVLEGLSESRDILRDMNTLSSLIVEEYANTRGGGGFSQTELDAAKTELRTLGTTISNKLTSLNSTYTTLRNYGTDEVQALADKNSVASKEQSLQSAKNELAKAKRSYDALKTSQNNDRISKQNEITRAKNTITSNELTYNEMVNGPMVTDLRSAENSIASANINLSKSRIALEQYQVVASFDGIVNDIPWKIGDTTTSSEGILVENKNAYEISLSLDQIDIVKIREGMPAKIVLDAFPTETYTGSVSRISSIPTETSGVVSYEAIVQLSLPRTDVYSKMSATVEVIVTEKSDILVIHATAITTEWGKTYVNKVTDISTLRSAIVPTGTMPNMGSGRTLSGERPSGFSGMTQSGSGTRTGSGTRMRPTTTSAMNIIGDVPTERIEIVTGATNGEKTEVVSGLSLGDAITIASSAKTSSSSSSTSSSSNNRTFGAWGPPPF